MKTHIHKILKLLFSVDVFADTEKKQSSVMSSSNTNKSWSAFKRKAVNGKIGKLSAKPEILYQALTSTP